MMMRRVFFVFSLLFLLSGLAGLVPAATSNVGAIDSHARTGFDGSVTEVGGSEASSMPEVVKSAINILLYVAGVIAVIIIVVGGLRFVTSEGDAQAANKAKNAVIYALTGLVVAVLAYALVNFILDKII
jgi:hypothetical protein